MLKTFKRVFVGRPLASADLDHQRLPKRIALAVFSSDAISSTAYASQEILLVTALGASSLAIGLSRLVPIAIFVAVLLAIVVTSYSQTIRAYPNGGGSYVVSRENLGSRAAMVAGASILVDYVLTVAVSVSAGVRAVTSIPAMKSLQDHRVLLCLAFITIITLANLRGMKESGRMFAVPTYLYIVTLVTLIGYGISRSYGAFGAEMSTIMDTRDSFFSGEDRKHAEEVALLGGTLGLSTLLRGFASGAVALTGVEAIADGVPAFQKPAARNASQTLAAMAVILGSLFLGVSLLATRVKPIPLHEGESVFSQMGRFVFGTGPMYYVLQISTALILILAANTAYADFPRLASIVARDGYLPRQFASRGDRLVFSNGVLVLAVMAAILVVVFGGEETLLIPLYAVGVFTSFTLSQFGMFRYLRTHKAPNWRRNSTISLAGTTATFVVLCIVAISKFTHGAWVSIFVVGAICALFYVINRHYVVVAAGLKVTPEYKPRKMNHTVIVLVGTLHRGALEGLAYAKSLHPSHLVAVTVVSDEDEQAAIEAAWLAKGIDIPLEIVHSPYRELNKPILDFVDQLDERWDNDIVTVVIPEFVVPGLFGKLLHNQSALLLKGRLLFRKGTVVTSVPYHLESSDEDE